MSLISFPVGKATLEVPVPFLRPWRAREETAVDLPVLGSTCTLPEGGAQALASSCCPGNHGGGWTPACWRHKPVYSLSIACWGQGRLP